MGATTHVSKLDAPWVSPLALWSGIFAGPVAWALDLLASYAIVRWVCAQGHHLLLHAIPVVALLLVALGTALSWGALRATSGTSRTDGGQPPERARFMAIVGLMSSALFALQILAGAFPPLVIDACR